MSRRFLQILHINNFLLKLVIQIRYSFLHTSVTCNPLENQRTFFGLKVLAWLEIDLKTPFYFWRRSFALSMIFYFDKDGESWSVGAARLACWDNSFAIECSCKSIGLFSSNILMLCSDNIIHIFCLSILTILVRLLIFYTFSWFSKKA